MIKLNNTKSSRTLLLLISFAMLLFLTACGGSLDEDTGGGVTGYSIAITSTASSLAAGESSIITATLTDGQGAPAQGKTVSFNLLNNNSGATITALNGGKTDAKGQAIATYTAGSNSPTASVQDTVQASASGATAAETITRSSSSSAGLKMTLTSTGFSFVAGESAILKAIVTDANGSPVSGQAVAFVLLTNNSGATLTILGVGVTDNSGEAQAIYKAGANSPTTSVQDIVQASITGASVTGIFTRSSNAGTATGLIMTLSADATSLNAGENTIIRATVTNGSGAPSAGQTVAFTLLSNQSGATLVPLNGGTTDASGQAIATYKAGANSPTTSVQDMIQASLTGTTGAVIITRTSGSGTSTGLVLALSAASTSLQGGESTIITAKVTSGGSNVQGQAVNFSFVTHPSGASLTILSAITDAAGEATTLYTAGTLTGATVQDIVQAAITGSTKAIIITKTGSAGGVTPSSLDISATPASIKTDGSTTSTIAINALNALNASLSGVVVTVGTDSGVLSAPTVTTPGTVTLSCGGNKANRTATITATAGSVSVTIPVQIVGSNVTVKAGSSSISAPTPATSTPLTITVKDAGGNLVSGAAVTLSQSSTDGGSVTLGATSGTTSSGVFTTTATGLTVGSVTITAAALGATGTTPLTVTATGATFGITSLQFGADPPFYINPAAMNIGQTLTITVSVPASTSVTFATTIGQWVGSGTKVQQITGLTPPTTVSANLTTSLVGIANIQVYDTAAPVISDTLTVAMASAAAPNKIMIQATPTVVPVSVGTTTGSSTLTATVYDASNNPLANQPVMFEIVDGTSTSGGETISPVVVMTATSSSGGLSVGQARTTFSSGSMPSTGTGVKIRASVVGTSGPEVRTGLSPSGNDAAIVIGGLAGSIAFGQDSKAAQDITGANYEYKMSVLVADANGNPVSGAVVNLGVWPIAWATGIGCIPDPDGSIWDSGTGTYVTGPGGTFWNEDANENLILDAGEDGKRNYYATGGAAPGTGTLDGLITPVNSTGGVVVSQKTTDPPGTVTTDVNGVAGFKVIYPKTSAQWIWDRIRATTIVQGTETRAEIILYLRIVIGEEVICAESPFKF
jgi:protocatechuate 3,4-dioxygenase beta subunit